MSGMWDHEEAGIFVEALFAKHHGEIYAYLLRMLREPELAADLTQDAFVKAYKNYDTLEKPENARAWLYQIAHRVALDEIRRRKIIRFFPWTGESHGSAPSAERLVMDAHLSGDMQRALARIPERQRAALLLAELHDMTGVELAAALGVSHVAARALLTRARESLRQALAAERRRGCRSRDQRGQLPSRGASPMSRVQRLRRRHAGAHERARALAAQRLDAPLEAGDAAWLDEHLAGCDACRSVAAAYEADRLALRAMRDRQPEPPRDLWARTASAIERESSARGGAARRATGSRRPRPALGVLSGVAVIAVVIGATVLSGGFIQAPSTATDPGATPPAVAIATTPPRPDATPFAVGAGSVTWVGSSADGALAYNVASVDEVCPMDRQPDCPTVSDGDSRHVDISIRPKSISKSPVNAQAVVVGEDDQGDDAVYVIALPTADPTAKPTRQADRRHPRPHRRPPSRRRRASSHRRRRPPSDASATPAATPVETPNPTAEPTPTRARRRCRHRSSPRRRPRRSRPTSPSSRASRSWANRPPIHPMARGSPSPPARRRATPARTSTCGASAMTWRGS